jgi:uncharacterized protein (TIGR03792 family)
MTVMGSEDYDGSGECSIDLPLFCQNKSILQGAGIPPALDPKARKFMVVEWLKVTVDPALQSQYLQADRQIWTAFLASRSGFVSKQIWLNPVAPDEVIMVITWASRSAWKAIPAALLEATEAQFTAALGQGFALVETGEYQVSEN